MPRWEARSSRLFKGAWFLSERRTIIQADPIAFSSFWMHLPCLISLKSQTPEIETRTNGSDKCWAVERTVPLASSPWVEIDVESRLLNPIFWMECVKCTCFPGVDSACACGDSDWVSSISIPDEVCRGLHRIFDSSRWILSYLALKGEHSALNLGHLTPLSSTCMQFVVSG